MDYHIGLFLKGLFLLIILKFSKSQIERDVILTPKLALHVNGKTLYYKPSILLDTNNLTSHLPWEQTLKHVTFLTLNKDLDENFDLDTFPNYKKFMNSSYIQSNSYIPKFGDIITLARGRLELNQKKQLEFIEGQCEETCDPNNVLAYWQVQKIRHRDVEKKFRYEIKFSVSPKNNYDEKNESGKREINDNHRRGIRSFIIKDEDYPKSFTKLDYHLAQRRSDENRRVYLEQLDEFNRIYSQPRFFSTQQQLLTNLNIGEYVPPTKIPYSSRAPLIGEPRTGGIFPFHQLLFPTTFRPNYHIKFDKPHFQNFPDHRQTSFILHPPPSPQFHHNVQEENKLKASSITTHLHHHYYMKNENRGQYLKDHRGAVDLIEEPFKPVRETFEQGTQAPISNQIPVPPKLQTPLLPPNFRQNLPQLDLPPNFHQQDYHQQDFNQQDFRPNIRNNIRQPILQPNFQQNSPQPILPHNFYQNTPIFPPNQLFYMHPIPISQELPMHFNQNQEYEAPKENHENKNRYSEPDPLYHSNAEKNVKDNTLSDNNYKNDYKNHNTETTETEEDMTNLENANSVQADEDYEDEKPDSINAQLPPPDEGQDLRVPYVETLTPTETSEASPSKQIIKKSEKAIESTTSLSETKATTRKSEAKTTKFSVPTTKKNKRIKINPGLKAIIEKGIIERTTKDSISELPKIVSTATTKISYQRSTTERPILKWKPKNTNISKDIPLKPTPTTKAIKKIEFERVPVTVTQKVYTVTPSKLNENDDISTKQSIATSITYKVGKNDIERPIIIPNLDIKEANLIKLNSTQKHIKIYKATEKTDDKKSNNIDKDEVELHKSILEHVQNL